MRIAFIGVSHWHAPLYCCPAARLAGIRIVAVKDPDLSLAKPRRRIVVAGTAKKGTYGNVTRRVAAIDS
jgi:hypothetical protein